MGMELITHGYTTRSLSGDISEAVNAVLAGLTDEWIEEHLDDLDTSGGIDNAEEMRENLTYGAETYDMIRKGDHRMSADFPIPGSTLWFTVTGGGSWGDDPYDGWYALGVFISACYEIPALAEAAGFICYGIADAATVAAHPQEA